MKRRLALILTLSLIMGAMLSVNARGEWMQNANGYYFVNNGNAVVSDWVRVTNNDGTYTYYYMGNDGYMSKGWTKINDSWYYFKDSGAMVTGWRQVDGIWYYMNPTSGKMQTG
ncbi:MAG: hypothetical protein MJ059_07275, partial [Lachnospiraceae bacterium]|nr:hypothetical protein [Lachnospiraceae bacterium]